MRLLNVKTMQLELFIDERHAPPYSILSHCWGKEEVTFEDLQGGTYQNMRGFTKLASCCRRSELEFYQYTWIDTCCIDKTSSTELSEAINSMFRWYQRAGICYAFLEDVYWDSTKNMPGDYLQGEEKETNNNSSGNDDGGGGYSYQKYQPHSDNLKELEGSRWFRRGWTLQELIAPDVVVFFDMDWKEIGTKTAMAELISDITKIDKAVLCNGLLPRHPDGVLAQLRTHTVLTRMSWASTRWTTRIEDEAYCLFGIFDVSMPLIYGEGQRAFLRLQQEIIRELPDTSILLWDDSDSGTGVARELQGVLASSPKDFQHSPDIKLPLTLKAGQTPTPNKSTSAFPITSAIMPGSISSTTTLRAQFFSLQEIVRGKIALPARFEFWRESSTFIDMSQMLSDSSKLAESGKSGTSGENSGESDHDDDDGKADCHRLKYYIAILSRTRNSGPVGILLEQLPEGTFARAQKSMSIWRFPEEFTLPTATAFIPRRASTRTMVVKTILAASPALHPKQRSLSLSADVHVSYAEPEVCWAVHMNTSRRPPERRPAFFAYFKSSTPEVLPSFAVVIVGWRREAGCCTVTAEEHGATEDTSGTRRASRLSRKQPRPRQLGHPSPQMAIMPVTLETMRMTLVPEIYDLTVSYRAHPHAGRCLAVVTMEPLEGAPDLLMGDRRQLLRYTWMQNAWGYDEWSIEERLGN